MPVTQTSILCYTHLKDLGKLKNQKDKIYGTLVMHPEGLTRWEIHKITGMMYSSICGRVKELMKGEEVTIKDFKRNDSGEKAEIVKALPSRRLDWLRAS